MYRMVHQRSQETTKENKVNKKRLALKREE